MFGVTGLNNRGRVGTHIFFYFFFLNERPTSVSDKQVEVEILVPVWSVCGMELVQCFHGLQEK